MTKITKITPRGMCFGVVDAYMVCKKLSIQFPNKKKYMIGWLVHNKHMIDDIAKLGIVTLGDKFSNREDLINSIDPQDNPIVIFSAHGTDKKIKELAKQKGLIVYDTTCEYVDKTHKIIIEKIMDNKKILFIGVKNHPETEAILSIDKNIFLLQTIEDIKKIPFSKEDEIFVTNQTTISILDFYDIVSKLKKEYQNIEFKNDICTATYDRQQAIINMDKTIDLLIVCGDINSNNSKKLVSIAHSKNVESYLVNNVEDLDLKWFENKKHIAITSGCSTPTHITTSIIKYIESYIKERDDNEQ